MKSTAKKGIKISLDDISEEDIEKAIDFIKLLSNTEEDDECNKCDECELSHICGNGADEKDSPEERIKKLFSFLNKEDEEESLDEDDEEEYTLAEIIREYEAGYTGTFVDIRGEEYTYDVASQTPLVITEVGTFPASITSDFMNMLFTKSNKKVTNGEALDLIRDGRLLKFKVLIGESVITGSIVDTNESTKLVINNPEDIDDGFLAADIMNLALLRGEWHL